MRVSYFGNLPQRNKLSIIRTDRDLRRLVRTVEVAEAADSVFGIALLCDASREIKVLLRDALGNIGKREMIRAQFCRVDIHDDSALLSPGNCGGSHSVCRLQNG